MLLKVLVACEESGRVRSAFRALGHDAWSNDIDPCSDDSDYHLQMDCRDAMARRYWDLIIMHPPCDYLAVSGNRWYGTGTSKHYMRLEAIERTIKLWGMAHKHAKYVVLENPVSVIWQHLGVQANYVQPYEHGHKEFKATGFGSKTLPALEPTDYIEPPGRGTPERIEWQKVWRMAPSPQRKRLRSKTYPGIAAAMADQWGRFILEAEKEKRPQSGEKGAANG